MTDKLKHLLSDNAFKSRKFVLTVFSIVVMLVGWFACAHWAALGAYYQVFVGGVIGALTVYMGGNVVTRNKVVDTVAKDDKPTDKPL